MKEAAGEANITVITIVLIAIVLAVGTPLISSLLTRTSIASCCEAAGGKLDSKSWCRSTEDNKVIERSTFWDSTNNKCKF